MNIRTKLRAALLTEGAHKDINGNKLGCVMVFLKYKKSDWDKLQDVIKEEDLYDPEDETGFGREVEPHVTILYGLHNDIEDKEIEDKINGSKTPNIAMGKVSSFTNNKFDVLKFDIESDDLHDLNKNFREFPYTSSFPDYHPHCTIAYLKKGKAEEYIKKIKKLDEIDVSPEKFVYSKADGSKKNFKLN